MSIKEKFYIREGLVVNGDTIITGSITTSVGFTGSFSGSLTGTASYSTTAQSVVGSVTSASFASTASYVKTAQSASYVNSLKQNVAITGSLIVSGSGATIELYGDKIIAGTVGGDEGGEILLGKPVTNTTLVGSGVTIDSYRNFIRFFEQGGSARGAYIDLTSCDGGVGTNLLSVQVLPTAAPTSPVNGSVYWDGNSATLFIYDGFNWKSVQLM